MLGIDSCTSRSCSTFRLLNVMACNRQLPTPSASPLSTFVAETPQAALHDSDPDPWGREAYMRGLSAGGEARIESGRGFIASGLRASGTSGSEGAPTSTMKRLLGDKQWQRIQVKMTVQSQEFRSQVPLRDLSALHKGHSVMPRQCETVHLMSMCTSGCLVCDHVAKTS